MPPTQSNQVSHIPPHYYFAPDQQDKLWQKRTTSKRRWRSLLSRRSEQR